MSDHGGILRGHKRIGKTFVPPMAQLKLSHTPWIGSILPDLVWIALLHDSHGDKRAAELALSVARIASDAASLEPRTWFAAASNYGQLPVEGKQAIASRVQTGDWYLELHISLAPLLRLYPSFPMGFILVEDTGTPETSRESDLAAFKPMLSRLFDRRGRPAMMVQATALYIAFVTEVMVANRATSLAEFPKIQDYPETEDSKRVGASVRAGINAMAGLKLTDDNPEWPRDFWNRGLELDACQYGTGGQHDA